MEKVKAPAKDNISSRLVRGDGSREHTDLNSEEVGIVDAQDAGRLPGKQVIHFNGHQGAGSAEESMSLHRRASIGGADGSNGLLAPGRSRELLDPSSNSLEDNNGDGPAAVSNIRDTVCDGKIEHNIH